jgi:hypothetical protein
MPDDAMDVMADFDATQGGAPEEIDIDFDFESGLQNEDVVLGDFEAADDMQILNSDPRDELMAEDEDGSFVMDDADDTTFEPGDAPANDIDLDISAPQDVYWQQTGEAAEGQIADAIGEIHPLEAGNRQAEIETSALGENDDFKLDIFEEGNHTGEGHEPQSHIGTSIDHQDFADAEAKQEPSSVDESKNGENAAVRLNETADGDAAGFEDSAGKIELEAGHDLAYASGNHEELGTGFATVAADAQNVVDTSEGNDVQAQGNKLDDSTEQVGETEQEDGAPRWDRTEGEVEEGSQEEDLPVTHGNDKIPTGEDDIKASITNDVQDGPVQHESTTKSSTDGGVEDEATPGSGSHHRVLVNYGDTEYRLFARSEDDDPNQYFLSDVRAVNCSLGEFISHLRDVISEELSALDELVLHIDGLGLEFGEVRTDPDVLTNTLLTLSQSVNSDFLQNNSFSDVLAVWDMLAQNDEAEVTDLYVYLIVRPSCVQRLAALVAQAKSGRGLSEVATYRQAAPANVPAEKTFDSHEAEDESYEEDSKQLQKNGVEGSEDGPLFENEEEELELAADDAAIGRDPSAVFDGTTAIMTPWKSGKAPFPYAPCGLSFDRQRHCQCDDCFYSRIEDDWDQGQTSSPAEQENVADLAKSQDTEDYHEETYGEYFEDTNGDAFNEGLNDEQDQIEDRGAYDDARPGAPEGNDAELYPGDEFEHESPAEHTIQGTTASSTLNGGSSKNEETVVEEGETLVETSGLVEAHDLSAEATKPAAKATLQVPEDEITWESDNEESHAELTTAGKGSIQASPHGKKRNRPELGDESDAKRPRSGPEEAFSALTDHPIP